MVITFHVIRTRVTRLGSTYAHLRSMARGSWQAFVINLDVFDIAHADQLIQIHGDTIFLKRLREPDWPGLSTGVDKKLTEKVEKVRLRNVEAQERRAKYVFSKSTDLH